MADERKCTDCGAPLPTGEPQPVCPACIFRRLSTTGSTISPPETEGRAVFSPANKSDTDFHSEYEMLGEIGRGGMGVIYKAHQPGLNRMVALKVVHAASLGGEAARRRFQSEVKVAARLNHPNLVSIFDVGELDGCPCFSMEFFSGGNLAERMQELVGKPETGVRLLVKVARAVFFAHQHGVLHRDLKPANILLDEAGEPHVADFGLAKQLDSDSDLTRSGAIVGSPNYMSPEQAAGKSNSLTVATDIYSLGVILYQVLTGRTPFLADTPLETMKLVVETDPQRPSSLSQHADRDLETICLKCLEKEPARRYHSAEDLAEDLERWLLHEPILARPTTGFERAQKWVRRHPALAALSAMLVFAFAFGFAGTFWQWRKAESARRSEALQLRRAEAALTRLELEKADESFGANNSRVGLSYLNRILRRDPSNPVAASRLMSVLEFRPFPLPTGVPVELPGGIFDFVLTPEGARTLVCQSGGRMQLIRWEAGTNQQIGFSHPPEVIRAGFSHDTRHALTVTLSGGVRLWSLGPVPGLLQSSAETARLESRQKPRLLQQATDLAQIEFTTDDRHALTFSRAGGVHWWDIPGASVQNVRPGGAVNAVALAPDRHSFVTGETDGAVWLWQADAPARPTLLLKLPQPVTALTFSHSGKTLAVGDGSGVLRLTANQAGQEIALFPGHTNAITQLAFAPDDSCLASGGDDLRVRLCKFPSGEPIGEPIHFGSAPRQLEFSRDGRWLLVRPYENQMWVCDPAQARLKLEPIWEASAISAAHFSPDGKRVWVAGLNGVLRAWDVTGQSSAAQVLSTGNTSAALALSPDGATVAVAANDQLVRLWNTASGTQLNQPVPADGDVQRLEFTPDASRLVAQVGADLFRSWDVANAKVSNVSGIPDVAAWRIGPDGRLIYLLGDGRLFRRALAQPEDPEELGSVGFTFERAMFSPGCDAIALRRAGGEIALFDVSTRRQTARMDLRPVRIQFAEFSPDGRRGVTPSADGSAKVWDVATGKIMLPPLRHKGVVNHAIFSPDGRRIATGSRDSAARLWDAQTGHPLTLPLSHNSGVSHLWFSGDSSRLVTATREGAVRVWDVETGLPLTAPILPAHFVKSGDAGLMPEVAITPDGTGLIIACANDDVRRWRIPRAPGAVPDWLLDLADAMAGFRQNEEGVDVAISSEHLGPLVRQVLARPATGDFEPWAQKVFGGQP